MNVLSLTAGAASMYCGSCLRDNALAAELLSRGHDVTLLPIYTPTLTDEPNVSQARVFFGGISVYLQQHVPLFRWTPAFLDRVWDSASVIRAFAKRQIAVDARRLGELTVSMLRGEHGHQRKELDKLIAWLRTQPAPDVVNLPFTLLIGLARPLREAFGAPICCTLQGEDLFLDQLHEPYKNEALRLIRQQVKEVDRFIAVSEYYATFMAGYLSIPADRVRTVPLGINPRDFEPAVAAGASASPVVAPASSASSGLSAPASASSAASPGGAGRGVKGSAAARPVGVGFWSPPDDPARKPFTIGYFARIAPEKGLDRLVAAYRLLRKERGMPPSRLAAAGYLGADQREYLERIELTLRQAGLHEEFRYHGELDRAAKVAFFKELDVFSMPAPYREPKGFSVLEAMASGVPVVQPAHGAFPEMIAKTGGGLLVDPDNIDSLAEGLWQLWQDRTERARLGRQAIAGVREHYTIQRMADGMLRVFSEVVAPARDTARGASSADGPGETPRSTATSDATQQEPEPLAQPESAAREHAQAAGKAAADQPASAPAKDAAMSAAGRRV